MVDVVDVSHDDVVEDDAVPLKDVAKLLNVLLVMMNLMSRLMTVSVQLMMSFFSMMTLSRTMMSSDETRSMCTDECFMKSTNVMRMYSFIIDDKPMSSTMMVPKLS